MYSARGQAAAAASRRDGEQPKAGEAGSRAAAEAGAVCSTRLPFDGMDVSFTIYIRWWSEHDARTRVNRLTLHTIAGASSLKVSDGNRESRAAGAPAAPAPAQQPAAAAEPPAAARTPQGVSKSLVTSAFPEASRPDYMTSTDYYCFTPGLPPPPPPPPPPPLPRAAPSRS
jgi:hypothetical protein